MSFVQLNRVSLAFGDRDILLETNLTLRADKKTALVGINGSGKSTLLKVLAGELTPDGGQVYHPEGVRIGYLPQSCLVSGGTVFEEAERAFEHLRQKELEAQRLAEMAAEAEPQQAFKLLEKSQELRESLEVSGWYRRQELIEQTLRGLGFTSKTLYSQVAVLSGGWQMRVALARQLLEAPDLLLLDEPTNYLDLEAKEWLETFLKRREKGFCLVSHDRAFLDEVIDQVIEISGGQLNSFPGNFSSFERKQAEEKLRLQEAWKRQQAELAKQEAYIQRFRAQATKAAGVQSRIKQLDKVERIELESEKPTLRFRFPPVPHSGHDVLSLRGLQKVWGDTQIFSNLDWDVSRGAKVAITGPNGVGKSTLMRILAGRDPYFSGTLRWGSGVQTAYFSQDHENDLDPQKTVLEELEAEAPTELFPRLRDFLGAFLFPGDDVDKKTSVLSGGEKNRLTLVKLLIRPANVLILDEPTNHLDIASKDVLLEALKDYEGTIFVVSHDKYFLSHLVDQVLELSHEAPTRHWGGWQDFARKLEERASNITASPLSKESSASGFKTPVKTESQVSRDEVKKRQALERRLQREEETLLNRLVDLEERLETTLQQMSDPQNYKDGPIMRRLQQEREDLERQREEAQAQWETTARELETLKT